MIPGPNDEPVMDFLLLLARGEKEIAAGVGHSLDQVVAA